MNSCKYIFESKLCVLISRTVVKCPLTIDQDDNFFISADDCDNKMCAFDDIFMLLFV